MWEENALCMPMPCDEEPLIRINSKTRTIEIPQFLKNVGVTGDHLSETYYFKINRYFDEQDLSEHKCIIRVINAHNEYSECDAIDIQVDDKYITFGWQISNYVTRYNGAVNFTVQFETMVDGVVKYQFQTRPAKLNVYNALDIESTITDKDDVLFRKLATQVEELQQQIINMQNKLDLINADSIADLNNRVDYLENNVIYVAEEID